MRLYNIHIINKFLLLFYKFVLMVKSKFIYFQILI